MSHTPDKIKNFLSSEQFKLYTLVWNRFVASQMNSAIYDQTTIDISAKGKYLFRATGSVLKFDGFLKIYEEGIDETPEKDESEITGNMPELSQGEQLKLLELKPNQHFTQPPARFSEPTLIKELESKGIGRPSTYATIVSTILEKDYVAKEKGRLAPTNLGILVTDLLIKSFPEVLDVEFTAQMEDQLDKIAEGTTDWITVLQEFYKSFEDRLKESAVKMAEAAETNEVCDKCGAKMVIKSGRSGLFLACSKYPNCRNTKPLENGMGEDETIPEQDAICEKCGGKMVVKSGRRGRFLACSNYPNCKNTKPLNNHQMPNLPPIVNEINEICNKCGAKMVVKMSRNGRFLACPNYPKCKNSKPLIVGVKCPNADCDGQIVEVFPKNGKMHYRCTNFPKCRIKLWNMPLNKACPTCRNPFLVVANNMVKCVNKSCDFITELKEFIESKENVENTGNNNNSSET
jgi:DNA topoisomerase-1